MYADEEGMWESYDSESWTIWSELKAAHLDWDEVFRQYWGLDLNECPAHLREETWKRAREVKNSVPQLKSIALALNLNEIAPKEKQLALADKQLKVVRRMLRSHAQSSIVKDSVGLMLARDALDQLTGAGERCLRLLALVQGRGVSPRASEFIKHATRLYVWGFDVECIIMCRSVLEAALVARLDDILELDEPPPPLDELIRLAGEHDLLNGLQKVQGEKGWRAKRGTPLWQAQRVKWLGNHAIHEGPKFRGDEEDIPDAFNAIRELSRLLGLLFPEPA
jgi:hypothetical protein